MDYDHHHHLHDASSDNEEKHTAITSASSSAVHNVVVKRNGNYSNLRRRRTNNTSTTRTAVSNSSERHDEDSSMLAKRETYIVNILRAVVLFLLLVAAVAISTGAYLYTRKQEEESFEQQFHDSAYAVLDAFHGTVGRSLGAVATLSSGLTSHALYSNQSFPFVTLPDFAVRGSEIRVLAGSHIIHWMPLVTEDKREEWEAFAMRERFHMDQDFAADTFLRNYQDNEFDLILGGETNNRYLQQEGGPPPQFSILEDGSNYHTRIWSNGALDPPGDLPNGTGPYLPVWQSSPIAPSKQSLLNLDFSKTLALEGVLDTMLETKKAIINKAFAPIPSMADRLIENLQSSQYRDNIHDYLDDPNTFFAYPVFDTFDPVNRKVSGMLALNIYWKILFSNLLPASRSVCAVIQNSYNQTFSFEIQGSTAKFQGMMDAHDPKFDYLKLSKTFELHKYTTLHNRAYMTVGFPENIGEYRIILYPSSYNQEDFFTNQPQQYMGLVLVAFLSSAFFFLLFTVTVEKRQHRMTEIAVSNANRATQNERELNEFLSHEVRNPLSAAISACTFVSTAVNEEPPMKDPETKKYVREDIEVLNTSLHFINDFLRSMLDIQRVNGNMLQLNMSPTDLLHDVLEPVSAMIHKRLSDIQLAVKCPDNLIVVTDCLRLKQIVLNLVRNSSKFVEKGFIRIGAEISSGIDHKVILFVEYSGPGIPEEKRMDLYGKYQSSLDVLSQGTGVGLSLSKKLMEAMQGDLHLDTSYDSGIEGCPGARFVLDLNTSPIDIHMDNFTSNKEQGDATTKTSALGDDSCTSLPSDHNKKSGSTVTGVEISISETGPQSSPVDRKPSSSSSSPSRAELAATTSEPPLALPEGLSILFVDDDAILRKLFVRAVKKAAPTWQIKEAASGEMAVQMCKDETFDMIFLDQYMASVDKQMLGTETAHALRSVGVQSKICGLSANDLGSLFLSNGANYFLLKPLPCKPDELKSTLFQILTAQDKNDQD